MTSRQTETFRGTDRFAIQGRIGSGGMGVVYRAFDRELHRIVALKTLRHMDPEGLYHFKREFRALADLSHPNLISLYELFSSREVWFFTMELVAGVDFLSYVCNEPDPATTETDTFVAPSDDFGNSPPSSESVLETHSPGAALYRRARSALAQLAQGLCALHDARKLHCDVKPSNVLVTTQGRVVLLDFGLVDELDAVRRDDFSDLRGTMRYAAPERLRQEGNCEASDWYSVGVVLYRALTGRYPYGDGLPTTSNDGLVGTIPSPAELVPAVPDDLNQLCLDLLDHDPHRRPTGTEVLRRLGAQAEKSTTISDSARKAPFVGRQRHLEELAGVFASVRQGRTVVMRVHGRSGVGKTALMRHFVDELPAQDEAVVLRGRCYERESVPYKALDSLVDDLCRYLAGRPASEVDALRPRHVAALARLFPVFRTVDGLKVPQRLPTEVPDRQELRRRAFAAMRELLTRLGDRRPLVLCLDDLQWGDLESALLLRELLRPPDPPLLLLVACYRSEDAAASDFLQSFLSAPELKTDSLLHRELSVDPLTFPEACELALDLLGSRDAEAGSLAETVARESRGNPYFVAELVHWLQLVTPGAATATGREITLQEVLAERVERLDEIPRRLLELLAVAGQPLRQETVCRAATLSSTDPDAIAVLRTTHLVRTRGPGEQDEVETYHDSIRESVVAHLAPARLRAHHRSLALTLESSGQGDAETLAVHFLEAGERERAGDYFTTAAERAAEALAFDRAAGLFRRALELTSGATDRRQALRAGLAESLANAGRGAEAAGVYREAAEHATAADRLELQRCAAMQSLISGHIDEGLAGLREVLANVDLRLPARPWQALVSLLIRRGWLRLRGCRFRARDANQVPGELLMRNDGCWSAAVGLSIVDTIRGADFQVRNLLLALRAGERYRVARGLAWEAAHVATGGGRTRRRTEKLLDAAQSAAEGTNDPHIQGLVALSRGIAAYMQGKWRLARQLSDEANDIFREHCTGVAWELDTAQSFVVWSLFFLGEVAELDRRLPLLLKAARERGDLYAATNLGTFSGHLTWLAADDPDGARRELHEMMGQWSQEGFHVQHLTGLMGETQIDLYRGDGRAAWDRLQQEWPGMRRSFFLRVQTVRVFMWHLRARSALASIVHGVDAARFLRHAARDARRIDREKMPWTDPMARLLRAGIASLRGDVAGALAHLESAQRGFETTEMGLYAAAAKRRRGELLGGESGETLIAEADAWLNRQGVHNPGRMVALHLPAIGR
jgi:eukaryotic-like serine/threonine-protein kinase